MRTRSKFKRPQNPKLQTYEAGTKLGQSKNCLGNSAVESELPWPADGEAGTGKRAKQEVWMDRSIQSSGSKEWIVIIVNGVEVLSKLADATRRKERQRLARG